MVFLSQVYALDVYSAPWSLWSASPSVTFFSLQGLADGIHDQQGIHIGADFPAQNDLTAQIQDSTHVQHAAWNRKAGNVGRPELIRFHLIEATILQIRILMDSLL